MQTAMRLNRFVAAATGISRRAADSAVAAGRVTVNGAEPAPGQLVQPSDRVKLDGALLKLRPLQTIMLHKPAGYVVSRDGQGSSTIYELLPPQLHHLKPVGRLDKDSSGLLLLTTDGTLAQQLTHPSFAKEKVYLVTLDRPLDPHERQHIDQGISLEDGSSRLALEPQNTAGTAWRITMHEGRNRQIRRTFAAAGYQVRTLHRTEFGAYTLGDLPAGQYQNV
jgi:23S rRNA pseudouridine2605 synthase